MNDDDVLSIVYRVVSARDENPTASVSELLAAAARARGVDPVDHVKVETRIDFRRGVPYRDSELMTRVQWKKFKHVAEKHEIDFGEINGKHSDVVRSFRDVTYLYRGNRADDADKIALSLLAPNLSIDKGFLARWMRNYDWDSDDDNDESSNKRAECEDAEVPAAKRVAPDDS